MTPGPSFTLDSARIGDQVTLTVAGEMDLQSELVWAGGVDEACATRPASINVDLGGITFIDSSGLRLLLLGKNTAEQAGVTISLSDIPTTVARLFEVTGMADEFTIR